MIKKIKLLAFAGLCALAFSGCYVGQVDSHEVGVVVKQGEVQKDVLTAGIHFNLMPFTSLEYMRVSNKVVNFIGADDKPDQDGEINLPAVNAQTDTNLPIPLDISVMYSLMPAKASDMRIKFGRDGVWDSMLITKEVQSSVRDVIGQVSLEVLNRNRNTYEGKMLSIMNKNLNPLGITISNVQLRNIGIPTTIKDAILQKETALQYAEKAKYEVERAKAEALIDVAKAEGIAKANDMLAKSLTQNLVQYKQLEIQKIQAEKWNGAMPTTMLGNGATPLISVK